jgi:hypothetical protein
MMYLWMILSCITATTMMKYDEVVATELDPLASSIILQEFSLQ